MHHNYPQTHIQQDYQVTEQQCQEFRKKGYIKLKAVADRSIIEPFREMMNKAVEKKKSEGDSQGRIDDYSQIFTQVTNLWQIDPNSRTFVLNKRFAQIAKQLLGVEHVSLYHDQALVKNSKAGKTPWHQDYFYWPIDSTNTVTMWMPMHDCPKQMGTMKFVAGSHLSDNIQKMPISEQSQKYFQQKIIQNKLQVQTYDLQEGDATFHYGKTLHCAHSNTASGKREVMTIIFMESNVRAVSEKDMNQFRKVDLSVFCPGVKCGQEIVSELNPMIV